MAKGRRVLLAWFRDNRSNWKLELLFLVGTACVFGVDSVMQASASSLSSTITYHIRDITNCGDCTTIGTKRSANISPIIQLLLLQKQP